MDYRWLQAARRAGVHGKLAMSCACARVRVAQPIVDLHFCRWWFGGYFFQALLKSCTSQIEILRRYSLLDTIYQDQRSEQSPRIPWVLILILIRSEAFFVFCFIHPELIRGFYWSGPMVNLPVLHSQVLLFLACSSRVNIYEPGFYFTIR